ncbi:MAG TPA: DUF5715 family protein [Streptosporangiaceae bacterium]
MWLVGEDPARDTAAASGTAAPGPDLTAYRAAVSGLAKELSARARSGGARHVERIRAERILTAALQEPVFAAVLHGTPEGVPGAIRRLLTEVRNYQPNARSAAADLTMLIKVSLLAQIDAMWWGSVPAYETDAQLVAAADLTDIDILRRGGALRFRYRRQASTLPGRAARAAERRAWPGRTPSTAGLKFARVRPEAATMLNQLALEFAALAPPGTPPLWVTSLARSVEHQRHLRALGYSAALPSAHCAGYAADVEMAWFARFGADGVLQGLLLDLQQAGDINVIDEGQAWHVCISPAGGRGLRRVPGARAGD